MQPSGWCSSLNVSLQPTDYYLVGAFDWICRCGYSVVIWLVQLIGFIVAIICSYMDIVAFMHDDVPGSGYLI